MSSTGLTFYEKANFDPRGRSEVKDETLLWLKQSVSFINGVMDFCNLIPLRI